MATMEVDVRDRIVAFKRTLAPNRDVLKRAFADVKDHVTRAADSILTETAAGRPVVPELDTAYTRWQGARVSSAVDQEHRLCGHSRRVSADPCRRLVRGSRRVYRDEPLRNAKWRSGASTSISPRSRQGSRRSSTCRLVEAAGHGAAGCRSRRDARVSRSSWKYEGASTLTSSAHMPTGYGGATLGHDPGPFSTHGCRDGRALDRPGYQKVYEHIFAGDWRAYDPFDATHRVHTHEIPSPAVCSMFRTYQGWTALTRQGPRDGTLRLIPMAAGIAYAAACAPGRR